MANGRLLTRQATASVNNLSNQHPKKAQEQLGLLHKGDNQP